MEIYIGRGPPAKVPVEPFYLDEWINAIHYLLSQPWLGPRVNCWLSEPMNHCELFLTLRASCRDGKAIAFLMFGASTKKQFAMSLELHRMSERAGLGDVYC